MAYPINPGDLAWAAGIFEGEGCFCINSRRERGLAARVQMTDEDIIRRLHTVLGLGSVFGPHAKPNRKPFWIWRVGSFEEVQAVMAILWGWLGIRRRGKIKELLTFYHSYKVRKHRHFKRGPNVTL